MSNLVQVTGTQRNLAGAAGLLRLSYHQIGVFVALADAILIVLSSTIGDLAYHNFWYGSFPDLAISFGVGIVACLIYVLVGRSSGLYTLPSLLAQRRFSRIVFGWAVVFLFLLLVLFLLKMGAAFSRGSFIAFAASSLLFLLAFRSFASLGIRDAMARGLILGRRAVVVGEPDELASLNTSSLLSQFGVQEVARVVLSTARRGSDVARIGRAIEVARDSNADEIVVALPWSSIALLDLVREKLRCTPLPVRLLPDSNIRAVVGGQQMSEAFSVDLQREPLTMIERTLKRTIDIVFALLGLLILYPLIVATAVAIKLDGPGPVVFRQRRNGFNGRQFVIYKFRTMTVLEDGAVVFQATKYDRRVTMIGRLLRRSSIDELPQLFNVLRGDMSLVGPRPHALAHDDEYRGVIANYAFRHHVKPGITGWAQINGFRGETARIESMRERIEADLWYINNYNLWLDLRILMSTCFEVTRGRGAY
jgi:Undecaprenyl-phosphate glucose phosphotransferase